MLYLVLEVDLTRDGVAFLVARVEVDTLERIRHGEIPLRNAFVAAPDGFVRRGSVFCSAPGDRVVRVPCAVIPDAELPTPDLCLG